MFDPKCPLLAVDLIIIIGGSVVIIERKYPPLGFALPGGMVDIGESTEDAAKREAMEEVQLEVSKIRLLGVYSNPNRDPRSHVVSIAYTCEANGTPEAADDAKEARLVDIWEAVNTKMVMDHNEILRDAAMILT